MYKFNEINVKERGLSEGQQGKINVEGLILFDDHERIGETIPLNRYPKLKSMLRLRKAGLPTLPGFVVQSLTPEVLEYIAGWEFASESGRVSLRFDSPNPEDNKRLMGSNPTIEELKRMGEMIQPPVVGIIMGTNDRFKQGHNILTYFFR